jgi:hypothetical protein
MWEWLRAILVGENKIFANQVAMEQRLNHKLDELKGLAMTQQEQLDAYAGRLDAVRTAVVNGTAGVRADIADLKAQIAAGTPATELDFTAVEASVAALEASAPDLTELDGENPAAPVEPTEPGEPA